MKNAMLFWVLFVIGTATSAVCADEPKRTDNETSPGTSNNLTRVPPTDSVAAAETIQLQDGFRAELIAAEPLVTDPIAMQYDENGLAYVVEMNDYPYSDKSHDQAWQNQTSEPIGRVRVLEDLDGDGMFDKSTVFADKLSWPSGVALWKGGVYVAATPDVWYFKDTNGDHRADIRRKVFTGFRKYNVQAVMNNFQWGLDHRIYAAGSSNGGMVESTANDENASKPIRLGRNDFRFDPRAERFEAISGGARFGHAQDDWGNRFLCNIRNPVQHVVLPARYLRRNPFLPVVSSINDVAKSGDTIAVYPISPAEPWRVINARRQAANTATKPPYDSTVAKGYVTSSSGVTIYRGAAYPKEFHGNAFIGEVAGNLVMRYRLLPSGVSFEGMRAHDKVEFLASTDNWFRPVNFVNAPDGTLHLLDMYRETIEHPWSMPDDLKAHVDLTSGRDRGRIYRLVPPKYGLGFKQPLPPRMGSASTVDLVAELENPNSWWRETSHRLIFERQDRAAETPLRKLLRDSQFPVARLHALWSLNGLEVLSDDDLKVAMDDPDPHVREHAVRLAEPRLSDAPELLRTVLAAASDDSIRVRFQAAMTLGEVGTEEATSALAAIARRDAANLWSRTAVLSSLSESEVPFLLNVLADTNFAAGEPGREMIGQLAFGVGARNNADEVNSVLTALARRHDGTRSASDMAVMKNLGAGLKRARRDLHQLAADKTTPGGRLVAEILDDALSIALAPSGDLSSRLLAIDLLGYGSFDSVQATLVELLDARQPAEIQSAAIHSITGFANKEVADILLDKHAALTPNVQAELVGRLLMRRDWLLAVFDAIEKRIVPASRVSSARRAIYMKSSDPAIRERAVRLFSRDLPGPRKEVIAKYQQALSLRADRLRGERAFKRECINCHRLGDQGHEVGPNLATIQNRSPAQLLVNLLDPNREVSPNFLEYIVATLDGRIITGIIASETPTSITLRQAEGKQQTILRSDIEEFRSSGKSLMAEGLEKKVTPQEMADLIAYLLSLK
ncbi:MAG: dehydrogenase [Planctomycetaceae bacterium]|nr:dehydrogenase [Planctomycetaceae bacterium]